MSQKRYSKVVRMEPIIGILLNKEAKAKGVSSNALCEEILMATLWPRCCDVPMIYHQIGPDLADNVSHVLTCPSCKKSTL